MGIVLLFLFSHFFLLIALQRLLLLYKEYCRSYKKAHINPRCLHIAVWDLINNLILVIFMSCEVGDIFKIFNLICALKPDDY